MKFTTLIPLRFNDGRTVPDKQMARIIDGFVLQFSGCSDEGMTKGQWFDPKDSQLYLMKVGEFRSFVIIV